jgi:hypothetical protein
MYEDLMNDHTPFFEEISIEAKNPAQDNFFYVVSK